MAEYLAYVFSEMDDRTTDDSREALLRDALRKKLPALRKHEEWINDLHRLLKDVRKQPGSLVDE